MDLQQMMELLLKEMKARHKEFLARWNADTKAWREKVKVIKMIKKPGREERE
jgi:formiminotetrahydrofolate cyclodeaminase